MGWSRHQAHPAGKESETEPTLDPTLTTCLGDVPVSVTERAETFKSTRNVREGLPVPIRGPLHSGDSTLQTAIHEDELTYSGQIPRTQQR